MLASSKKSICRILLYLHENVTGWDWFLSDNCSTQGCDKLQFITALSAAEQKQGDAKEKKG